MFSREIANGLFWVPNQLTVFQIIGCTKGAVQSRFLGLNERKVEMVWERSAAVG